MPHCKNCDTSFEHADELDREEVDEVELVGDSESPKIQIGTGKRDVWRCSDCGVVLGVR